MIITRLGTQPEDSVRRFKMLVMSCFHLQRLTDYRIEHLEGNPQGPSLSFASGWTFAALVSALLGVDCWVFFAVPLPCTFVSSFTPPPSTAPPEGPSSLEELWLLELYVLERMGVMGHEA